MDIQLTLIEARILGCLVEKELTTPDYYPLSLNSVTTACNQKQNRDPVMALTESQVMEAMDTLISKHLARERTGAGSRVTKYAHRLGDSLGLSFGLERNEVGTLCVLMLRGPQTPGEIRARTGRLCEFGSLEQLNKTLSDLMDHERGPYIVQLPRQPGTKEARYAHLLCGDIDPEAFTETAAPIGPAQSDRVGELEQQIEALRARLDRLEQSLGIEDD